MQEAVIARVHIDRAGDMTDRGRKEIADWLRIQADLLEEEGPQYAEHYVARYLATIRTEAQKELNFG